MADKFLDQIKEDLQIIKNIWMDNDKKLENDWYAFNYWILNYLYHIDIEDIPEYITEYNDKGIDCFVHFEDAKELYLIQNCYYSDQSSLKRDHIADFLLSPVHFLSENSYSRSKILQDIFNTIKNDKEYTIYLYCYTTKSQNTISNNILSLFNDSSINYAFNVETKLIDLNEIESIYKGKRFDNIIHFEYDIEVLQKELIEQKSEQHDKDNNVDTAYVAVNVFVIYEMLKKSIEQSYNLFDKNIREYLGIKGTRGKTNKNIQATLLSEVERNRFFYYNNGITIICDDITNPQPKNRKTLRRLVQPQIVNGCQTVTTIYNTIDDLVQQNKSVGEVAKAFKHCSILVKIFKVNKSNDAERIIYENIVKYTNTQTGITAKDFASKDNYFLNLQNDFLERGFYLIVKQSDKHKYESDIELFKKTKLRSENIINIFNKNNVEKPADLFIDLDKLLKCLLSFYFDGYTAFKSGSSTLNEHSVKYYMNFSKKIRDYFSTDSMINLFLTYRDAGGTTIARTKQYPIPYYMMDFIGRFIKSTDNKEFDVNRVSNKLSYLFSSREIYNEVYNKISEVIEDYGEEFKKNGIDYSTMTKNREIDFELLDNLIQTKKKEAFRNNWTFFTEYMS